MASYGDPDGDGFLEYDRKSVNGLINQGWKDSSDSIFHADGRLAEAPIALAEVQAYAYAAYLGAAELGAALGKAGRSRGFETDGRALREKFERPSGSKNSAPTPGARRPEAAVPGRAPPMPAMCCSAAWHRPSGPPASPSG
jgi:hypothetical protein